MPSRTRTATSTRSTPSACGARTCATSTATVRSRPATASTSTATTTSVGTTTTRAPRPSPSSDTYRGTSAASEPETQAHQGLIDRMKFKFLLTYHSYGPLLLYPYGWQVQTPSFDDPLFVEYTGNDAHPAVEGFDPGVGRRPLHDQRHDGRLRVLEDGRAELDARAERGLHRLRLRLPGRRGARPGGVREEPAVRACGSRRSTLDPANPVGATMKPFYLEMASLDPEKYGNPLVNFKFNVSYGDPQPVQVIAKRSLGAVVAQVPGQRRRRQDGGDLGGLGRRAVRLARRRLLPPVRGNVTGTSRRATRSRSGSRTRTTRPRRASRSPTAPGPRPDAGCSSSRPRTTAASRRRTSSGARCTSSTTSTRSPPTASRPTSTTSTRTAGRLRARSASSATTTPSSGTPATTSSRASRGWCRARRRGLRTTRCWPCASTSRRAAGSSTRARTPACSTRDGVRVRPRAQRAVRPGLGRRRLPGTSRTTSCSTTSAPTLYNDDAGTTPNGSLFDVIGVRHAVRWPVVVVRRHQREQPGRQRLVHRHERDPARETYPQFRSWASAKCDRPGGAVRPAHGRPLRVLRRSQTCRTSGSPARST